jgi:hypothetical protein
MKRHRLLVGRKANEGKMRERKKDLKDRNKRAVVEKERVREKGRHGLIDRNTDRQMTLLRKSGTECYVHYNPHNSASIKKRNTNR